MNTIDHRQFRRVWVSAYEFRTTHAAWILDSVVAAGSWWRPLCTDGFMQLVNPDETFDVTKVDCPKCRAQVGRIILTQGEVL